MKKRFLEMGYVPPGTGDKNSRKFYLFKMLMKSLHALDSNTDLSPKEKNEIAEVNTKITKSRLGFD